GLGREGSRRNRQDDRGDEEWPGCQLAVALRPVAAYGLPFSAVEMSRIAFWARMLLPASSSGGETTAMPKLPGETAMMPPPTPLFAGSPVWYSHLPESSYRPAVAITASTAGTFDASITCLPVTG